MVRSTPGTVARPLSQALVVGICAALTVGCSGQRPVQNDGLSAEADESVSASFLTELEPIEEGSSGVGSSTGTAEVGGAPAESEQAGTEQNAIVGNVEPPQGGVTAIITPTGVLVAVTGQTEYGYVVQTPCGNEAQVGWGQPLRQIDVVLDPGHGGTEQGAVGVNGLTEADLNLRVAQRSATLLAGREIPVVLTRSGNYRLPITQRAAIADALQTRAFVSIHHNTPAAAESDTPGTEVYVQQKSEVSNRLGGLVYEEVTEALSRFDIQWVSRADAGLLEVVNDAGEDSYGINRRPTSPSVLVELAYLGNPAEAQLLASDEYVTAAATALADAIQRFLQTEEVGSSPAAAPRLFNPSGATGGESGCVDPILQ